MKTFFSSVPAVLLALGVSAGCVSNPAESEKAMSHSTVISEAQGGADISIEVGQQLEVRLQSNRATGYQWVQTEPMRGMLRDASPRYEVPPPPEGSEPRPGAGGVEIFSFAAARPGTQVLAFEYRRSWESDKAPAKKIRYRIVVE